MSAINSTNEPWYQILRINVAAGMDDDLTKLHESIHSSSQNLNSKSDNIEEKIKRTAKWLESNFPAVKVELRGQTSDEKVAEIFLIAMKAILNKSILNETRSLILKNQEFNQKIKDKKVDPKKLERISNCFKDSLRQLAEWNYKPENFFKG